MKLIARSGNITSKILISDTGHTIKAKKSSLRSLTLSESFYRAIIGLPHGLKKVTKLESLYRHPNSPPHNQTEIDATETDPNIQLLLISRNSVRLVGKLRHSTISKLPPSARCSPTLLTNLLAETSIRAICACTHLFWIVSTSRKSICPTSYCFLVSWYAL